ncbi:phenylalanyl-tRNA synthetase subunit alpha [Bacteroidetes bacterium UKL13-3]|nr:phenylalanyl-tRNA synthetase subunit alpha [Bacteroidetes bacterium UKL13-3]
MMPDMINKLKNIISEVSQIEIKSADEAEQFRLKYLSRKGILNDLFEEFKTISNTEKKEVGKVMNELKQVTEGKLADAQQTFTASKTKKEEILDLTLPPESSELGARHPLNIVQNKILSIFNKLGFTISEGPEIEDDWHNFSALNFPENHPARDMQDTFFIDKNFSLRTHCTSVQVRLMEQKKIPLRAVMPGRVYRNEAISARAHCFFHQIDAVYIDKNVSFADLKQTLYQFVKEMFGEEFQVRFRPSYFPFTEPSAEMDISCMICKGSGCNVCKHTGWVEILGCGMVDPNVLTLNNIDPEEYSGFAFGMGVERITMLLYEIKDLRLFSINDTRFIKQFTGEA